MRLTSSDTIRGNIAEVFAAYADHDRFEQLAIARGAAVTRRGAPDAGPTALTWDVTFPFRGRTWDLAIRIAEREAPRRIRVDSVGGSLDGALGVTFTETSPGVTEVATTLDVSAKTIAARIVVASLTVAQAEIQRRYAARLASFAQSVERSLAAPARPRAAATGRSRTGSRGKTAS